MVVTKGYLTGPGRSSLALIGELGWKNHLGQKLWGRVWAFQPDWGLFFKGLPNFFRFLLGPFGKICLSRRFPFPRGWDFPISWETPNVWRSRLGCIHRLFLGSPGLTRKRGGFGIKGSPRGV